MMVSSDPMTRSTRRAANAAAAAVVVAAALWAVTTQLDAVRAISPFAEDPWDAIATYGAIFLPLVAGPTWIRSLRHRSAVLPSPTAGRIRWGAGLAAAIVLVMGGADAAAIAANGFPAGSGLGGVVIGTLVSASLLSAFVAIALTVAAARTATSRRTRVAATALDPVPEPDVVEDLLALAADLGRPVGLRTPIERFAAALERFLEGSGWSPRRHRIAFGIAASLGIGVAFALWHSLREGPPPSPAVPLVFAALIGSGVLAAYLGTLGPLRLLRPPAR